jgi:hypothetical protein
MGGGNRLGGLDDQPHVPIVAIGKVPDQLVTVACPRVQPLAGRMAVHDGVLPLVPPPPHVCQRWRLSWRAGTPRCICCDRAAGSSRTPLPVANTRVRVLPVVVLIPGTPCVLTMVSLPPLLILSQTHHAHLTPSVVGCCGRDISSKHDGAYTL